MSVLSENQLEMLRIAKRIDQVCKENDIEYSLAYGTMLGAVRHKGFIPWDDDMDIMMDWNNFEKFLSVWGKYPDDSMYLLSYKTEKKYPFLFPKIVSKRVKVMEAILSDMDLDYGVWVDIFPIIVKGEDGKERKKQHRYIKWGNFLIHKYFYILKNDFAKKNHNNLKLKGILFRLIPDKICFSLAEKLLKKAAIMGTSDEMIDMRNENWFCNRKIFDDGIEYVKFENIELPILRKSNEFLTILYGNWKTPVKYTHEFEQ